MKNPHQALKSKAGLLRTLGSITVISLLTACSEGAVDGDNSDAGPGGGSTVLSGGSGNSGGENSGGSLGTGSSPSGGSDSSAGGNSTGSNSAGGNGNPGGGAGGGDVGAGGMSGADEDYPVPYAGADEDGGELWLRFPQVPVPGRLGQYQEAFTHVVGGASADTLSVAESELIRGLSGLTGNVVTASTAPESTGGVVIGTPETSSVIASLALVSRLPDVGAEGYIVESTQTGDGMSIIAVAANSEIGVLYGSYALLRHAQSHSSLEGLSITSSPKIEHRILNHWDNLDRSVERGYAGRSLWNWDALPGTLSPRYEEYAKANASIGINGTVLTNVNADAQVLTPQYLSKVQALADVFRPYGIRVYLTARFSAPIEIGGLNTADPTNASVGQWWADKATEIYSLIPDFGGFLVKANSEGQPGPQDYGATHAQGANMLADAVEPHGGIIMWRAFVYAEDSPVDRIREAYDEFKPLDGQFRPNVLVQPKNGPLDFQPREPFHPLFGGMPQTPLALELQITKEYLGQDQHLSYVGPWYEEVLQADTYASGAGSTVARVVDGSLHGYATTAIAGVSNVGDDTNWTGSHFNQANWYAYGRMAWDPDISARVVAEEWVRLTLSGDPLVVEPVTSMMMNSHQALVNYMTPLGLVHIMASTHHYGPGPWVDDLDRPEWNPVYYHKADSTGLGFDRTPTGSNAVEQYFAEVEQAFSDRATVPDDLLLFFHHVGWTETMSSGRNLWEELVHRYSLGVDSVQTMRDEWASIEERVDAGRFAEISAALQIQHYEARWWRDACLTYFEPFSGQGIPAGYAPPANTLSDYQGLTCPPNRDKPRCTAIETGTPSPAILP